MDPAEELANYAPAGAIKKVRYTHADMIDCIIAEPWISQGALAARYGYTQSWISSIMASDAWQSALAARKEEVVDPALKLTIEERMRGLVSRSIDVVMKKLDAPVVSDNVALKALELGAKGLGLGNPTPPPPPAADHLAQLANRLIDLQEGIKKGRTYEGETIPNAG